MIFSLLISSYIKDNNIFKAIDGHEDYFNLPFFLIHKEYLQSTLGECTVTEQMEALNKSLEIILTLDNPKVYPI